MFPKLFGQSTAIGLDLQGDHFCAVRVRINDRKVELTHHMETPDFGALGRELEKADRVVTRPPPKTWFNRRAAKVSGDWTAADQPTLKQRGLEVFRVAQRWTPLPMEQTLFGWEVLSHHSGTDTSEIEIHQSEKNNCHEFRLALQSLKLGPVYFEAWHTTALRAAIPPRFTSYILETRSPDGYALIKNGSLVGHVDLTVFHPPYDPEDQNVERLKSFLAEHLTAGKGPLQAYFLNRNQRAPQMPGLSCSWIGDNCRELVGEDLSIGCLQALGLALSSNKEWWLHHVDEFRPGPVPMQRLRSVMSDIGRVIN